MFLFNILKYWILFNQTHLPGVGAKNDIPSALQMDFMIDSLLFYTDYLFVHYPISTISHMYCAAHNTGYIVEC